MVSSPRGPGRVFSLAVELPYLGFEGTILGAEVVQNGRDHGVINLGPSPRPVVGLYSFALPHEPVFLPPPMIFPRHLYARSTN